ncbi:ABC transporter ATP-binding protein [Pseudonocardia sp. HH130630-07]|uniref:ABC transporter ATP-binding protein n=1 Tax=Pseudonocardia sp. HH130630-07 TaxID=1690815 RepID=UPI000814C141|nr:ABC transporter ATP-binding protein [Pseudonocardia sp. HH130630-07]ANY09634.1 multidrug ABC transporter permease [Pseudonocardia sp. HH130630-07]
MSVLLPVAPWPRIRALVTELGRPQRGTALAALGVLFGAAAASLLAAPLLGDIVDRVAQRRGADAVLAPVLGLAGVAVVQGVLAALGVALAARFCETVLAGLRERFVDRALHLPQTRVEAAGAGDLTARVTDDVAVVGEAVREAVPELVRAALLVGLTLVGLAVLDWRFLLAALLAVPVQAWTARAFLGRSGPFYAAQRTAAGAQQQQLLDTAGGLPTVRAYRLHERHAAGVADRAAEVARLVVAVIRMHTQLFGRLNLAEYIGLAAVLGTGFWLVSTGATTIGTASAAALYFVNLFTPINVVLFQLDAAQTALAGLRRIVGVADLDPPAPPARLVVPDGAGLRVRGLTHHYVDGHPVLADVDLDVAPGERVALVGASGAGKSTLAGIVAGVHTPAAGVVEIGGARLDDLSPDRLREAVVLVTQESHVFAGTLAADLRLAAPDADDDALLAALDRVGAGGWARALPDGLATVVGDGGHRLPVVAAQQLALARVLLTGPRVLVLDEATAEAGSAGARVLEESAEAVLAGRTAIVVAHRLTQAAAADRVVVLDAGRVVEQGTHDELVAGGGRYARLWAAWTGARSTDPADPAPRT